MFHALASVIIMLSANKSDIRKINFHAYAREIFVQNCSVKVLAYVPNNNLAYV